MNNIVIEKLSAKNEKEFNEVVDIIYEWWAKEEGYKIEVLKELISSCCDKEDFPVIIIAKTNGRVVGCGSLISNDIPLRQDLFPVLSSLYVKEEYRNQRIGSKIVEAIIGYAKKRFKEIYLMTSTIGFYEKLGFQYVETSKAYINIATNTIITNRLYKIEL